MASLASLLVVSFVVTLSCADSSARIPSFLAQQTVSTVSVNPPPPPSNFPTDPTSSPTFPTDSPPGFSSPTSPNYPTVSPHSSWPRKEIWRIVLLLFLAILGMGGCTVTTYCCVRIDRGRQSRGSSSYDVEVCLQFAQKDDPSAPTTNTVGRTTPAPVGPAASSANQIPQSHNRAAAASGVSTSALQTETELVASASILPTGMDSCASDVTIRDDEVASGKAKLKPTDTLSSGSEPEETAPLASASILQTGTDSCASDGAIGDDEVPSGKAKLKPTDMLSSGSEPKETAPVASASMLPTGTDSGATDSTVREDEVLSGKAKLKPTDTLSSCAEPEETAPVASASILPTGTDSCTSDGTVRDDEVASGKAKLKPTDTLSSGSEPEKTAPVSPVTSKSMPLS